MKLKFQYSIWVVFLVFLMSCGKKGDNDVKEECNKDHIRSNFLLTAAEAKGVLDSESDIILIHVGKSEEYESLHIPNAINIWRPDFRSKKDNEIQGLICSREELEGLLSVMGVDTLSNLLIYDNKGSVDALRFAWVLEYYGFLDFKVINGGLASWQKAGYPTSSASMAFGPSTDYHLKSQSNETLLASLQEVKTAVDGKSTIIVDTREDYEYLGQPFISGNAVLNYKKGAFASGAIPNAVHLNWSILSDLGGDHRIKCEKDLRYDLESAGITPDKKVIVYCQSGSRSSHTAFVLRHILDYPNVKNYDGSWIEWSYEYVKNRSVEIDQKTDIAVVIDMKEELELKLNLNSK